MYIRKICKTKGCKRLQRRKGIVNGKDTYGTVCDLHRKTKNAFVKEFFNKQSIPNKKCSNCSWSKASCDRHRKIAANGYTKKNVIILCPNCHRLKHLKLI